MCDAHSMTTVHPNRLAIDGGAPVRATLLPYGRQSVDASDVSAVAGMLSEALFTTGPHVAAFEAGPAATCGAGVAVVNNGTSALHAAYQAMGLGEGDEIVVPPLTFAATAVSALWLGARPVFADLDPATSRWPPRPPHGPARAHAVHGARGLRRPARGLRCPARCDRKAPRRGRRPLARRHLPRRTGAGRRGRGDPEFPPRQTHHDRRGWGRGEPRPRGRRAGQTHPAPQPGARSRHGRLGLRTPRAGHEPAPAGPQRGPRGLADAPPAGFSGAATRALPPISSPARRRRPRRPPRAAPGRRRERLALVRAAGARPLRRPPPLGLRRAAGRGHRRAGPLRAIAPAPPLPRPPRPSPRRLPGRRGLRRPLFLRAPFPGHDRRGSGRRRDGARQSAGPRAFRKRGARRETSRQRRAGPET